MSEDKKNLDDKVNEIIKNFDDLNTAEIEAGTSKDDGVTHFSDILSKIAKDPDIAINTEIGQWKILKKLGQGGMSIVYLVERNIDSLNQKAALKIIPSAFTT